MAREHPTFACDACLGCVFEGGQPTGESQGPHADMHRHGSPPPPPMVQVTMEGACKDQCGGVTVGCEAMEHPTSECFACEDCVTGVLHTEIHAKMEGACQETCEGVHFEDCMAREHPTFACDACLGCVFEGGQPTGESQGPHADRHRHGPPPPPPMVQATMEGACKDQCGGVTVGCEAMEHPTSECIACEDCVAGVLRTEIHATMEGA